MEVKFSRAAAELFNEEVEKYPDDETGGILLGFVEDAVIHVEIATDGGPNAIHEPLYFQADKNYVDMKIDMAVGNSDGKINYLGEWHTHPEVYPNPSTVDLQSLKEIADTAEHFTIMLILGAEGYGKNSLTEQSICLIKYNDDKNFYKLPVVETTFKS